jgi:hypothetical protein
MGETTFTSTLTIGELEANYTLYCKALRILILEDRTVNQIRRSVCWHRLETLHKCLPRQYKDPEHLYFLLKREISK